MAPADRLFQSTTKVGQFDISTSMSFLTDPTYHVRIVNGLTNHFPNTMFGGVILWSLIEVLLRNIPLATGTHFIKSGLPVCPVFPFRAVYSSKTCTLRRFTQFMQFMQTEQFMQFMRFVLVYQKTGPDRSRPVLEQTA